MELFDLIAAHKAGDVAASRALADLYCNSHQYDSKNVKAFAAFISGLTKAELDAELVDMVRYEDNRNGPIDEWAGWVAWFNRVGKKINKIISDGVKRNGTQTSQVSDS